jgi:hypothetical protein
MKPKHKEDPSILLYILIFLRNINRDSSFLYIDLDYGKLNAVSLHVSESKTILFYVWSGHKMFILRPFLLIYVVGLCINCTEEFFHQKVLV